VLGEVGDGLRGIPLEYDPTHMLPQQAYHGDGPYLRGV
jgi:hypothetical protein